MGGARVFRYATAALRVFVSRVITGAEDWQKKVFSEEIITHTQDNLTHILSYTRDTMQKSSWQNWADAANFVRVPFQIKAALHVVPTVLIGMRLYRFPTINRLGNIYI